MKILRIIVGNTLRGRDRVRNNDIRATCKVEDIVRWRRKRRSYWKDSWKG